VAADPAGHDPTLIRQGEWFYDFTTGVDAPRSYLPIRRSQDLVRWEPVGAVFTLPPAWVVRDLGVLPSDFWAPDVSYFDGRYHVYYAASLYATNNSVIGLATNATLDPSDPAYEWVDEGVVLRSVPGVDSFNAIDPDVVLDEDGAPWLSYGSFWTGLELRRLDPSTGKPPTGDRSVHPLAGRPPPGAIEAPSIQRHGRFYYLFASFDRCCIGVDSDYRLVVGRSERVSGPYVDRAGIAMELGGGTEILRGHGRYAGTGHSDVYRDGDTDLLIHHYYDREDGGLPKLSVREVDWSGGWPELGAPLSERRGAGYGGVRWNANGLASWKAYATPLPTAR